MRAALSTVPSAYQVAFDLDRDEVYVAYDAAAGEPKLATEPMVAALKAAGFEPWFKREGWPEVTDVRVLPAIKN